MPLPARALADDRRRDEAGVDHCGCGGGERRARPRDALSARGTRLTTWRAAARRFALLLGGVGAATAAISVLLGLALGSAVDRAASVGFYLVGSFLLVAGFFVGNRGPARLRAPEDEGALGGMFGLPFGRRGLRWATPEEREEAIASSAVFITLGFALIILGIVADSRVRLV